MPYFVLPEPGVIWVEIIQIVLFRGIGDNNFFSPVFTPSIFRPAMFAVTRACLTDMFAA